MTLRPTRRHAVDYPLPDVTIGRRLLDAARSQPDTVAVIEGGHRLSFAQLASGALGLADELRRRGIEPGDVVLSQLPNWWEAVVLACAVQLAGAVHVPVVPIYRQYELAFIVGQTRPKVIVAAGEFRSYRHADQLRELVRELNIDAIVLGVRDEHPSTLPISTELLPLREPVDVDPEAIAVVLYTSGTTSAPKGVLHSHQTLLAESRGISDACRLDPADRVFMPSPLSHITGLSYGVVLPLDVGCGVVLVDRWEPAAGVELIEREQCTFTVSATPFLRGLAAVYRNLGTSSLHTFICGGADIPTDLVREAAALMSTRVVRTYGSTEMPTACMADPFGDLWVAASGEGPAMNAIDLAVRPDESGIDELLVRGPELFLGYLDANLNEASFTSDGYFRTGDTAVIDSDGTVHISGRIKDIINRGGEKYSAAEVEAQLLAHPDVEDVAVVAYADPELVERACAFVVATPGHMPSLDGLREHLVRRGLAIQKAPERLVIVESLPRTASGKVQKFKLKDRLQAGGVSGSAHSAAGSPSAADSPVA